MTNLFKFKLNNIDPTSLRQQLIDRVKSALWTLDKLPPTRAAAQEMYQMEYKFGTILNTSTAANPSSIIQPSIYDLCRQDLSTTHLYVAAAAWLRPPESLETWADLTDDLLPTPQFNSAKLANLHYGLAWQRETKGFLIATRDLLGVEPVEFSSQYSRDEQLEVERCVNLLFN